jgi:hypothetical protein
MAAVFSYAAHSQCPYPTDGAALSNITYDIKASLEVSGKKVIGSQKITWKNIGDKPVTELRFYMYMNAFKNMESTFLKSSNGVIFGSNILNRNANEWGYISLNHAQIAGRSDTLKWKYIQPDDGNIGDESVLSIALPTPIKNGESITLSLNFVSKLPKFIARAGYSRDDYFAFLHWYPQLGVYEKNKEGIWAWNCHQFFRQTEFFADFADYHVVLTLPDHLKIASSGCVQQEVKIKNKHLQKLSIQANNVIDFAWIAYPYFVEHRSTWNGVDVKLMIPPEHGHMAPRYMAAIKHALDFFKEKIGTYPYPSITMVDPPMHGMGSGFMEYPMMITTASFCYVPVGVRTIESLAVHEFSHQYFMAILASNEKEEAWLDEGFVTFFEDEIMDTYYGRRNSIFDLMGYTSGNRERSRLEYSSMENLRVGSIARPGWTFAGSYEGSYKGLVYAKTSTILQTLKGLVGEEKFYTAMKHYYEKYKFKHPKENDFISSMKEVIGDTIGGTMRIDTFFYKTLHGTDYCDYSVDDVYVVHDQGYKIDISNHGGLYIPVDLKINYTDGTSDILSWNGNSENSTAAINTTKKIDSVILDPMQKNYLDINFNNNSFTYKYDAKPAANYSVKTMTWVQHLIHSLLYLI